MDHKKQKEVDKYLLELSSQEEQALIEQEMAEDESFKAYVEKRKIELQDGFELFAQKKISKLITELNDRAQVEFTDEELEAFVGGDLPDVLADLVKTQMETDPELRKRVEAEQKLLENLQYFRDEKVLHQLNKLNEQQAVSSGEPGREKPIPGSFTIIRKRWFWMTAAAVLILAVAFALFSRQQDYPLFEYDQEFVMYDQDLISAYVKKANLSEQLIGIDTLLAAMKKYLSDDPQQADPIFEFYLSLSNSQELTSYVLFYSAQLKMERGDLEAALAQLKQMQQDKENLDMYRESLFSLAILYLENEDQKKARELLLELKEANFNVPEVEELLKYTRKSIF